MINIKKIAKWQLETTIIDILSNHIFTRNSDQELIRVIRLICNNYNNNIDLDNIYYLPTGATITRIRAKLNQQWLFLPTDKKVIALRKAHQKKLQIEYWPTYKPNNLSI